MEGYIVRGKVYHRPLFNCDILIIANCQIFPNAQILKIKLISYVICIVNHVCMLTHVRVQLAYSAQISLAQFCGSHESFSILEAR